MKGYPAAESDDHHPLAPMTCYAIRFLAVMSASVKPRLAGRQPSNRGGVPRVMTRLSSRLQLSKQQSATRQARVRRTGPQSRWMRASYEHARRSDGQLVVRDQAGPRRADARQ